MTTLIKRFSGGLPVLLAVLLGLSLAACGGSSSDNATNPPQTGGDPGGDDDDDDDDDSAGANISPEGALGAREAIVIAFDDSVDPESLELGGSLAADVQAEWSADAADNDTLTLTPVNFWPVGTQTLTVNASGTGGSAYTADAEFDVAAAFATFQEATLVIGQQDFAGTQVRQGSPGAGANTLDTPMGPVEYAAEQDVLFIPDNGSSRVVAFNGIPTTNNEPADFVLGQPGFETSSGATDAGSYRNPQWVTSTGGKLLVTDSESRRVLVYNAIPETGPVDADVVVGQADMEARVISCDDRNMHTTHGHFVTPQGRLFVSDADNNRVFLWNEIPTVNGTPADLVLGQPDFNSCAAFDEPDGSEDMRIFNHPVAIWSDDERVIITDNENHRILIWNEFPTENFAEPDVILGQNSFENVAPNDDNQDGVEDAAPSARTMHLPWSVTVHGGQMFVSDSANNRVLIWNGIPEKNFAPADIVIGQPDFESNLPNLGNATAAANTLNGPRGAIVVGARLFITDTLNSRVLAYDAK